MFKKILVSIIALLSLNGFAIALTSDFPHGMTTGTESQKANVNVSLTDGSAYIPGTFEVDGASRFDGTTTITGAMVTSGTLTTSGKKVRTPTTQTGITISSLVVVTSDFMVISSSGGAVINTGIGISTATATNPNGTTVILMGGSDTDSVTMSDSATFALGGATRAIGLGDILELIIYNGIWYELGFTNN